jgi:hypothetical protein
MPDQQRMAFDASLLPRFGEHTMIAYPDAFYRIARHDLERAVKRVGL